MTRIHLLGTTRRAASHRAVPRPRAVRSFCSSHLFVFEDSRGALRLPPLPLALFICVIVSYWIGTYRRGIPDVGTCAATYLAIDPKEEDAADRPAARQWNKT